MTRGGRESDRTGSRLYRAMGKLLTLREVAEALGVSEQRVYQLDDVLDPVIQPRGTKMKVRWYRPEVVERVRVDRERAQVQVAEERAKPRGHRELNKVAAEIAARVLRGYADAAPFFAGVTPDETDYVRARLRIIAARTE